MSLAEASLEQADLSGADLFGADLLGVDLTGVDLQHANLMGVRRLDKARGLKQVRSWQGATIERKWVKRLRLDAEKLGLEVVDDVDDDQMAQ